MADFYTDMAQMARELLAPTSQNGLGQGVITLSKTSASVNPGAPWEIVTDPVETDIEQIKGAARGVSRELVGQDFGGPVVLASDLQVITEVPKGDYTAGDTLSIDSVPHSIIAVIKIPAAGITSAVKYIVRRR